MAANFDSLVVGFIETLHKNHMKEIINCDVCDAKLSMYGFSVDREVTPKSMRVWKKCKRCTQNVIPNCFKFDVTKLIMSCVLNNQSLDVYEIKPGDKQINYVEL